MCWSPWGCKESDTTGRLNSYKNDHWEWVLETVGSPQESWGLSRSETREAGCAQGWPSAFGRSLAWPLLEAGSEVIVREVISETPWVTWAFEVELVWPWFVLPAFPCDCHWVIQIQSEGQWPGRARGEEGKARVLLSQLVKGRAFFSPRNFLCAQFGRKSVIVIPASCTLVNSDVA